MKWIFNMKITFKIISGYVIMLLMMGFISHSAYTSLSQLNSYLRDLYSNRLIGIDYLVEADRDLQQLLVAERSLMFSGNDPRLLKEFIAAYNENMEQSDTRFNKYKELAKVEKEESFIKLYELKRAEWKRVTESVINNIQSGDSTRAINISLNDARIKFEEMRDQLNSLEEINLDVAKSKMIEGEDIYSRNIILLIVSIFTAVVLAFILGTIITQSIRHRINSVNSIVKDLSEGEGDLTVRINDISTDEFKSLGSYFNKFLNTLEKLIISVKNSSLNVATISGEVSSGNLELSSSTQQMASNIEEISANVEEIVASIKNTVSGAVTMTEKIMSIADSTEACSLKLNGLSNSMNRLKDAGKKIGTIVDVVNEIAFQTNLIALNASVEAARAGNEGRGFAVVANEIRNLAKRSSESVKKIKELVDQNSLYVNEMDEISNKSVETLSVVVTGIRETKYDVNEIKNMISEQSMGIEQINMALTQIDHGVQENAAHVEQLATSSETMLNVANELSDNVKQFKVSVNSRS